jgi:hypothetical protein
MRLILSLKFLLRAVDRSSPIAARNSLNSLAVLHLDLFADRRATGDDFAVRQNRPTDHLVRLFTTITFAMPAFLTALIWCSFSACGWSSFRPPV